RASTAEAPVVHPSRTLTVSIARAPAEVAAFIRNARNLPRWAFFSRVEAGDGAGDPAAWRVWGEGASGAGVASRAEPPPAVLRFVEENSLGVLAHTVTLPSGEVVSVPLRVVANGAGSEVMLTVFQPPGMPDSAFEADARTVAADLAKLK